MSYLGVGGQEDPQPAQANKLKWCTRLPAIEAVTVYTLKAGGTQLCKRLSLGGSLVEVGLQLI